jgi:hypothetical protein
MRGIRVLVATLVAACGGGETDPDGPTDGPGGSGDGPPADGRPDAGGDAADGSTDGGPDAVIATCTTALLYNDCDPALDANCASIPEPLRSDDAAAALGIGVLYGGNNNQVAFRSLFDAGGFDVIVFESSSRDVDVDTATRLATWVQGGGKIVFSFWDLDNETVGPGLRAALELTTTGSFDTPRSVHTGASAAVDFFDRVETFPSPLGFSNIGIDDGDELATTTGLVSATFTSATGPGAIVVTNGGNAVVFGFLPIELVYALVRDGDSDGKPDVEELYTNALGYLCGS